MPANFVEIQIKASDTAKPDLTELQARLKALQDRTLKINVDDKAAVAAAAGLQVRFARLQKLLDSVKLGDIGALRAAAQIAALDAAVSRLADKAGGGGGGGIFGVKSTGLGGAGGTGFGKVLSQAGGIIGSGPLGLGVLGGAAVAAAALLQTLGSVVPVLAAAGMGMVAFGAVAIPVFSKITAGAAAVGKAVGDVAKDKAWAAIPAALRPAVQGVLAFQSALMKIGTTAQGDVLKVFNAGLTLANRLLPFVAPFARTAATALDGLLKQADKFAASAGFKAWMVQMQTLAGPAIRAIGQGIGEVVIAMGKLLRSMMSPQGLVTLQFIFQAIAKAIDVVRGAFNATGIVIFQWAPAVIRALSAVMGGFQRLNSVVMGVLGAIVNGAAAAFGWVPGLGPKLRQAAATFDAFRTRVDAAMTASRASLDKWATALANAPKVMALKADITNLTNNLATARALLRNPDLTATRRARVEANIDQLLRALATARGQLIALQGYTVTTYIQAAHVGIGVGATPHAAGGIVGGSGLVWAGERGPELIQSSAGSRVYNASQSRQATSGAGAQVVLQVQPGGSGLDNMFLGWLRHSIRVVGGAGPNSVQVALGRGTGT